MEKLIFLDIDGVLNSHEPLDPDVMCGQILVPKVQILNRVLRDTGAKIVLSSAWRYLILRGEMDLTGFEWLLRSHGVISGRLAGYTRADTMVEREHYDGKQTWPMTNERGGQVSDWLKTWRHQTSHKLKYAVVDDLDLGITEAGHPFVHVDGTKGLTLADQTKLMAFLT
jgi:hypothetical protein